MKDGYLLYPDICKFVGIFFVTWSHCAQRVSGMVWPNFLGGYHLDVALAMPFFMIISGSLINLDKMRNSRTSSFILSKLKRLIVPSLVWYFVLLIFSFHLPDLSIFTYYWYLNALFACLCVIMICVKIIKNNSICWFVSTSIILIVPYSDLSHINFMMPFLWAGYTFRKICNTKYARQTVIICFILGLCLCPMWNPVYSVYLSPFNSLYICTDMVLIMFFRFIIGFTLSAVIIYLIFKTEKTWISHLSQFGSYSLVIYTSSLVLLAFFLRVFDYFNIHTNRYFIIDVLSLLLCTFIIFIAIKFADLCRKKKILQLLFLGE